MTKIFQYGRAGTAPEHRAFFQFPPVSLDEMRQWVADGAGENAIGIGAVVNKCGTIVGELVMPGGKEAYMVGKDGVARPVPENYKVIFAQVGYMQPEQTLELDVANKEDLQKQLEALVPEGMRERFMVRISGQLPDITFRTVDTQDGHPETLPELLDKHSFTFHYCDNAHYRLVGVFSKHGAVEEGVTFDDALHLHGLDAADKRGGHVNDFNGPAHVKVDFMPIAEWLTATHEAIQTQQTAERQQPEVVPPLWQLRNVAKPVWTR